MGRNDVHAAREVMHYFGTRTPDQIATMFPMIRARAWSRVNAAQSRHGSGILHGTVEVLEQTRAYANYFALDEDIELSHERFDGGDVAMMLRTVFIAADAACSALRSWCATG